MRFGIIIGDAGGVPTRIINQWRANRATSGDVDAWMDANAANHAWNACAIEKNVRYLCFKKRRWGRRREDLSQPAYANRLAEICAIIHTHNISLIRRACSRDFDPAKELDRSANGAASYLHDLVATIVLYEEGRVPWQVAKSMCESTAALLTALQELSNAPIGELDKAGVAFRLLLDIAGRYYPQPSVHRDKYEESLFKAEEQVNSALDKLHEKYVEIKYADIIISVWKSEADSPRIDRALPETICSSRSDAI